MQQPRNHPTVGTLELTGGAICLDLVNTLDERLSASPRNLIGDYEDLLEFASRTGNIDTRLRARLADLALGHASNADLVVSRAHALREALYTTVIARISGGPIDSSSVTVLERELLEAGGYLGIRERNGTFERYWVIPETLLPQHLAYPLWPIADSAADLLANADVTRLRICEADDCGVVFLDTTRNRSRRWCSHQGCGNRARVRSYRSRKRVG